MTDIIGLAKERRNRLEQELSKLDEFIRMGEILLTSDQDRGHAPVPSREPIHLLDELSFSGDTMLLHSGDPEEADGEEDEELLLTDMAPEGNDAMGVHVGMRIRHRRWMLGISQQDLANTVGISAEQMQRIETGGGNAESKHVSRIASALNVSVSYFLEGMHEEGGRSSSHHTSPSSG